MTISKLTEMAFMTALFTGTLIGAACVIGAIVAYILLFLHGVIG